jgi:hypothetical protein
VDLDLMAGEVLMAIANVAPLFQTFRDRIPPPRAEIPHTLAGAYPDRVENRSQLD